MTRILPPTSRLQQKEARRQPLRDLPEELIKTLAYYNRARTEWSLLPIPSNPDPMAAAEKIVARGMAAREFLSNPSCNEAYQLLLSSKVDQLLATPAGDFDRKKLLSFEIQGLQDIMKELAQFVTQSEQLRDSLENSGLDEPLGE